MTNFLYIHQLLFNDKKKTEAYRVMQTYLSNWFYYLGNHWNNKRTDLFGAIRLQPDKPLGEVEKQLTVNYIFRFIEKKISFMFGKGFNIQYFDEDTENNKELDKFFNIVWKVWNNSVNIGYQLGQCGMICGDAYAIILVDEFDDDGNFDADKEKKIKIEVINPLYCLPEWNPKNPEILNSFEYRIPNFDSNGNFIKPTKFYIDKNVIIVTENDREISRNENPYGFVPVVHIPHQVITGSFYGRNEVEDILGLNLELNWAISNISDVLDYAGNPVTVIKGASAKNYNKKSRIWGGLPPNADVENLNLATDLKAHINYIDTIKTSLHEISAIPPGSLGGMEHISNTSGVALTYQLLPLIEDNDIKSQNYIKGIRKLNEYLLRIGVYKGLISKSVIDKMQFKYQTNIYLESTLPKDELLQVQVEDAKIKAGISTKVMGIKAMGEQNPEKVEGEINAERYQDMLLRVEEQRLLSEVTMNGVGGGGQNTSSTNNVSNDKKTDDNKTKFASGFESNTGVHKDENKEINDLKRDSRTFKKM